ncbi:hypothetical protein [Microlunatus flavus]|uniref:Uncharacterized protein n=1 Tax=Microlunatus flavus TaxID=1036181 RepID=A0A1H9G5T9_9ACTN|nr:hypothetical protein [Microlunatus flavus]SEQ45525.1 hypothetical protein SAMN05421756_103511 [Microlunatus flavus]
MATTTLLVFALGAALAMIAGVVWILWEDASTHRRAHNDLETCEAIWALTPTRRPYAAGES